MADQSWALPTEAETTLEGRLATAVRLAMLAGQSTLPLFRSSHIDVERKGDDSPVTAADRQAEQTIRERLAESFPKDSILGEEFGTQAGSSEYQWIVDPIDGTKSFISGVPLYSTLIGIVRGEQCLGGVIYLPALDEIVFAARGIGAWHSRDGRAPLPARVSQRALEDGVFVVSQLDTFAEREAQQAYTELEKKAYISRTWGDGYGYLLIATGRAELMVDPIANAWDLAPVQPVVEEAGGHFTNWAGKPTAFDGDGVASNAVVHPQALRILNKF